MAKKSASKASIGGRKAAGRRLTDDGVAVEEVVHVGAGPEGAVGEDERALLVPLIEDGRIREEHLGAAGVVAAREHRANAVLELPLDALRLGRGDPVIPTRYA